MSDATPCAPCLPFAAPLPPLPPLRPCLPSAAGLGEQVVTFAHFMACGFHLVGGLTLEQHCPVYQSAADGHGQGLHPVAWQACCERTYALSTNDRDNPSSLLQDSTQGASSWMSDADSSSLGSGGGGVGLTWMHTHNIACKSHWTK